MNKINLSNDELRIVASTFKASGAIVSIECIKSGHINDTYKVTYQNKQGTIDYILQRINSNVFSEPKKIMENIEAVTKHIRLKYIEFGWDVNHVMFPLNTMNNTSFWRDANGEYWRMYSYIKDGICYEKAPNEKVMRSIGRAFGLFQMLLSDFPAQMLHTTIEDFHNTKKRFQMLETVIDFALSNPLLKSRLDDSNEIISTLFENKELAFSLENKKQKGLLPLRVTHNDTKCNNVMLDRKTDESLAVIDLDTVMPGLCAHDFGDAIRAGANNANEDETDISKIFLDINKFEAFTQGFITALGKNITDAEYDSLALGAPVIAFELAARFLTDYLNGDKYFKIDYPKHNLDRARCQATLACDMVKKLDKMEHLIKTLK